MRIAIVGAGALGSIVGGLLHEAGREVYLIRRDTDLIDRIRENGLLLEGVTGDRVVRPWIGTADDMSGKAELVLVLVKAYDTRDAAEGVKKVLAEDGAVLTLQNGVGNYEILDEIFPGRVLLGTTTIGALNLGNGAYRHTGKGETHFGEADGALTDRARRIAEVLSSMEAGSVHVTDNAVGSVWSKLIVNAAINAPGTLLRLRNGDLPSSVAGRGLIRAIVEECVEVVKAKGIAILFPDPEGHVLSVCEGTAQNLNSMFQDIRLGRRTEIDFMNGAIDREAQNLQLSAPVNRTLADLIRALEATADARVTDPS